MPSKANDFAPCSHPVEALMDATKAANIAM
jgi:hypothetical protein